MHHQDHFPTFIATILFPHLLQLRIRSSRQVASRKEKCALDSVLVAGAE